MQLCNKESLSCFEIKEEGKRIINKFFIVIAWISKGQKIVTLPSSEEQNVIISKALRELILVYQLKERLMIKAELPIQEKMDNVEATFSENNKNARKRPKRVDTRH
jgi:hypothetical protein